MMNSQFSTGCDVDCLEGEFTMLDSVWMMDGLEDEFDNPQRPCGYWMVGGPIDDAPHRVLDGLKTN